MRQKFQSFFILLPEELSKSLIVWMKDKYKLRQNWDICINRREKKPKFLINSINKANEEQRSNVVQFFEFPVLQEKSGNFVLPLFELVRFLFLFFSFLFKLLEEKWKFEFMMRQEGRRWKYYHVIAFKARFLKMKKKINENCIKTLIILNFHYYGPITLLYVSGNLQGNQRNIQSHFGSFVAITHDKFFKKHA